MPNYVYNTVTFKPEDVDKVKELVCSENREFDFNRIVPRPEELNICSGSITQDATDLLSYMEAHKMIPEKLRERYPDEGEEPDPSVFYRETEGPFHDSRSPKTLPELRVFAKLIQSNKEKYGTTDWYDWSYANWGTKWNACEPHWSGNQVYFDTAWADPEPVFIELSKKLGITFDVSCEEESLAFCSVTTYSNGGKESYAEEEGIAGLVLLGYDRADIIARYEDWYDENEMADLNQQLDNLGI